MQRACVPSARQPASHPWWVPAWHRSLNQSAAPNAQENSLPCPSHSGFCLGGDPGLTEVVQAVHVLLCAWHLPGLQGAFPAGLDLAMDLADHQIHNSIGTATAPV